MSEANHGVGVGVSALSVDCSCSCVGLWLSLWWTVAVAVVGCDSPREYGENRSSGLRVVMRDREWSS